MQTVLIVIHLMIVLALVGVVLMQRSEGGGLGIGGGSGLMSARGAANALTRTTGILAAAFFVTSIGLGILARFDDRPSDILDRVPAASQSQDGEGGGILDQLGGAEPGPATQEAPVSESAVPSGVDPAGSAAATPPADGATDTPASSGVPTGQ